MERHKFQVVEGPGYDIGLSFDDAENAIKAALEMSKLNPFDKYYVEEIIESGGKIEMIPLNGGMPIKYDNSSNKSLSEKLAKVASWLESSENDLLLSAESDGSEEAMGIVAEALVLAGEIMKSASEMISAVKSKDDGLTGEKLSELAEVATAFDESGDELLQKQANVLDEILFLFADSSKKMQEKTAKDDARMLDLKRKYQGTKEKLDEFNKVSDTQKLIEKAPVYQERKISENGLSTRWCPRHAGVSIVRLSDNEWQCPLDSEKFDFRKEFGSVEGQSQVPSENIGHTIFDTRNQRLGLSSDE